MGEPFKNLVSKKVVDKLAADIKVYYESFQTNEFIQSIIDETWESLELKQRVNRIAENLKKYLPQDYKEAISIIDKVIASYGNWLEEFCWFFPSFVELYGLDDENWDISIGAMARYTKHSSAEFAVRPFIVKNQTKMMAQMYEWSKSDCEHVRRLSSEGCRPALPWGMGIPNLKKDPTPVLPILEQLKNDPAIYVRKSVANNLNDISKTHPEIVIKVAKEWYGKNKELDWIVKHGCRTLLKKGNREVLALFGCDDTDSVEVSDFAIEQKAISIGEDIIFSFTLKAKKAIKVRLEYGVDYVKATGKTSQKVFKISEILLKEAEVKTYTRKHSFEDVSVRKHYPGIHGITLIVNGNPQGKLEFELKK
ncbi:MAG: DNA alkylation repair protein [Erysipelotrichales bacterium]|nr:DNA alkylation repair protein [Erysipelotrichales bacterium]